MNELELQGDQTAEEYRAYCKLHFGVVIRKECEEFAEQYDKIIRPLPYELKLQAMAVPIDAPITRGMTAKQKTKYLNAIYVHFTGQGMHLSDPSTLGMEGW